MYGPNALDSIGTLPRRGNISFLETREEGEARGRLAFTSVRNQRGVYYSRLGWNGTSRSTNPAGNSWRYFSLGPFSRFTRCVEP